MRHVNIHLLYITIISAATGFVVTEAAGISPAWQFLAFTIGHQPLLMTWHTDGRTFDRNRRTKTATKELIYNEIQLALTTLIYAACVVLFFAIARTSRT